MTNRFNYMSENDVEFDLSKWIYCFMADVLFEVFVGRKGHASDNHYSNLTGQKPSGSYDKDKLYIEYLIKYKAGYVFYLLYGTFAKYVPVFVE